MYSFEEIHFWGSQLSEASYWTYSIKFDGAEIYRIQIRSARHSYDNRRKGWNWGIKTFEGGSEGETEFNKILNRLIEYFKENNIKAYKKIDLAQAGFKLIGHRWVLSEKAEHYSRRDNLSNKHYKRAQKSPIYV